jgi:hypothetical protein
MSHMSACFVGKVMKPGAPTIYNHIAPTHEIPSILFVSFHSL